MIFDVAIVLTWLAAGYRVWVVFTQPRTIWRTSVCIAMIATAVAFTLYRNRTSLDQFSGSPNLSGLLAHVIFTLGLGFLLIYLEALRRPDVSAVRMTVYLVVAAVTSAIMVGGWIVAPVHNSALDDLAPLARNASVVVYCIAFWAYLVWVLSIMAWTCLARSRLFRREDPTRFISLLLIGVSAAGAIPAIFLWAASILVRYVTGAEVDNLNELGDKILPWPLLLNAAGALSLFLVPYLGGLASTWSQGRQLKPLWETMIARHPEVHLEFRASGGPLTRLQTKRERAIIEIRDALRIARVNIEGSGSLESIAAGLRRPTPGSCRASDLLERVDTRDADIRQMLALARAFRESKP